MNANQNLIRGIIVAVALIIGGGLFLVARPATTPVTTRQPKPSYTAPSPTVEAADLDASLKELDTTDVDANVDTEMSQLDVDASTF